jgi:peptide deformylase
MRETLHADTGRVGLAAPQVGVSLRVTVIGLPDEEDIILINAQIVRRKGQRLVSEGCLSIPGYVGELYRAESVTAKGLDLSGKEIRIKGEGLLSQALEHEIDHLNGILYVDHLESTDTLRKIEPEDVEI